jgi:hypothetical protein
MKALLPWLLPAITTLLGCAPPDPPPFIPAPESPIAVAGNPGNVVLGDVNRDGKADLVVASKVGLTVLLGRGDGRFKSVGDPVKLPVTASELVLHDLTGDGILDVAAASHDAYRVMLLPGDGRGGFALAPNSPIVMKDGQHPHTHGLLAGDLNGDGRPDLVTVNSDPDNDISVALGDGRGGFAKAPGSPFAVGPGPYPATLADLDGDGRLDIIATTTDRRQTDKPASRELTVLYGDGQGGFRRGRIPLRTPHPWFVAVADLTGDGRADLVATHAEARELSVLIADGRGGFSESAGSPFDLGHSAWQTAVLDVNRDGRPDVIAAAGDGVRVLLGEGRGGFRPAPASPVPSGKGTWRMAVGDLNGDGKPDVATSNLASDTVTVLLAQ